MSKQQASVDVLEGGKLIANFDLLMNPDDTDPKKESWYRNDDWVHISHLKYHSSWDWLMPVVEVLDEMVIPKTLIDSDYPEHVFTSLSGRSCWVCVGDGHKIFEAKGESKIASAWKAITDFIQWHNDAKIKAIMKDEAKYGNRQWE